MSNCPPNNGQECRTIQVIEPDGTLLVGSSSGGSDQSLDESGSEALYEGQDRVAVVFETPKAGNYRFEFLYVDAFGQSNPGNVAPVPVIQNIYGFTVDLAGAPILDGYFLRWRVVVFDFFVTGNVDAPESIYLQLPQANLFEIQLTNPRSATNYGFNELRVENLVDPPGEQTPILPQVVQKTQVSFRVALSPTPPTDNYFLAARLR